VLIFNYKTPFSEVRSRYLRNTIRPNGSFSCEYLNLVRSLAEPSVHDFDMLEGILKGIDCEIDVMVLLDSLD
jgi:hypothetical protein